MLNNSELKISDQMKEPIGLWFAPAVIQPNNFVYKSLSSWSFNVAIGCSHACKFCYVPSASTIKQSHNLNKYGILDPDSQWGEYVLLRPWNEQKFLGSLQRAEKTPTSQLNPDGNRAVMYCTTTDPYQAIHHPDPFQRSSLFKHNRNLVRRSLELILERSTVNVRILTRSPIARLDFDLFKSFGNRLLFGMSLPTLRNDLAKIYEPKAPAPTQRLATLQAAKEAGLNVYVAIAPTYPECNQADLYKTLEAVAKLDPITVFHEPINLRADNAQKIAQASASSSIPLRTEVFASTLEWSKYAIQSLRAVWEIGNDLGLRNKLHLWPDKILGSPAVLKSLPDSEAFHQWLRTRWTRISEWPQ